MNPSRNGMAGIRSGVESIQQSQILSNSLSAKGLFRHSSVSTTERHYIKDVPESTLQAMNLLETLCNARATAEEAKPCLKNWGERRGLNPRPSVPQTDALPAELRSPPLKY